MANLAYQGKSSSGWKPIAAATTAAPAMSLPIATALLLPIELPGKVQQQQEPKQQQQQVSHFKSQHFALSTFSLEY